MADTAQSQQILTARLIESLQADEFALFAQDIVPIATQRPKRKFQEIFIRYTDEDAKMLPPGSFFSVLEECHLLPFVDRWVVNKLARLARDALKTDPDRTIPLNNVNLSLETLADLHYGDYVRRHAQHTCLAGGALGFEISWEDVLPQQEPLRQLMQLLRPHGCQFTLADFDASDPSFAVLEALAPQFVKISASTLNPATASETLRRCHALGCELIVEHVESKEVLEHLRRIAVDFVQGFELSPVQPIRLGD
jgi:diguanylate cyclase